VPLSRAGAIAGTFVIFLAIAGVWLWAAKKAPAPAGDRLTASESEQHHEAVRPFAGRLLAPTPEPAAALPDGTAEKAEADSPKTPATDDVAKPALAATVSPPAPARPADNDPENRPSPVAQPPAQAEPPAPAQATSPQPAPADVKTDPISDDRAAATTCSVAAQKYGTSVDFVDSPTKAAELARKEDKLLFVLHVAGNFEDDKFT
jgi:hypothetical protein